MGEAAVLVRADGKREEKEGEGTDVFPFELPAFRVRKLVDAVEAGLAAANGRLAFTASLMATIGPS